jgi:hypothetical protein
VGLHISLAGKTTARHGRLAAEQLCAPTSRPAAVGLIRKYPDLSDEELAVLHGDSYSTHPIVTERYLKPRLLEAGKSLASMLSQNKALWRDAEG